MLIVQNELAIMTGAHEKEISITPMSLKPISVLLKLYHYDYFS